MAKLVQRLQGTRDKVYGLSDRFGVVGHCDAIFVHRIHRTKFKALPRPRLVEPESRMMYGSRVMYKLAETIELNREDKMLVGISRAGFENYERVKAYPDGGTPDYSLYEYQLLDSPVEAGYVVDILQPTDITVSCVFHPSEYGLKSYIKITSLTSGVTEYQQSVTAEAFVVVRDIALKPGAYAVSVLHIKVLPLFQDHDRANQYVSTDGRMERTCFIASPNGERVTVEGSYTPTAVAWGSSTEFDYIYNGAVCYIDGKTYTILYVNSDNNLQYDILVRPERSR